MIRSIDVAISQLGIREATGRNDGIPAQRYMRGDELPWCAGFVLFCNEHSDDECLFDQNGDGEIDRGDLGLWYRLRSVAALTRRGQELGMFLDATTDPLPNDYVVFGNTASDVGVTGNHIGIVESYDPETKMLTTIEGNYSNQVARVTQKLGTRQITGYVRVGTKKRVTIPR